jgi:recombination protein RecR
MTPRWDNLVLAIKKLPGVGPKMAERIAMHLLRSDEDSALINAIKDAKNYLRRCSLCGIYTESEPCKRCTSTDRDAKVICVVEEMSDLVALERSGAFQGHYHLLGGVLSPLDGIGPKQLRIDILIKRLEKALTPIEEVIIATNPTVEGEATATYLAQLIHPLGPKITRLAYGLPAGASLEHTDETTLTRALEGRRIMID